MNEPKKILLGVCSVCSNMYDVSAVSHGSETLLPCGHKLGHVVLDGAFIREAVDLQYKLSSAELCQECAEALGLTTDDEAVPDE